jgi:hypothetical protein
MRQFTYQALPMRVVFGAGSRIRLADEVADLGLTRVLVLCSPKQRDVGDRIAAALGGRGAGLFSEGQRARSSPRSAPQRSCWSTAKHWPTSGGPASVISSA